MDEQVSPPPTSYKDDDLVYVDPKQRSVVGPVQWSNAGKPKSLPMLSEDTSAEEVHDRKKRPPRQRMYPWGTYRSMKNIYKLEGKKPREESSMTLDEALKKALQEPFWN